MKRGKNLIILEFIAFNGPRGFRYYLGYIILIIRFEWFNIEKDPDFIKRRNKSEIFFLLFFRTGYGGKRKAEMGRSRDIRDL